jgi:gluconokinase
VKTKNQQYKALRRRALWFLAQQMSQQEHPNTLAPHTTHVIVMGVSGCGKSTLARALATQLGWPMIEGDEYHPAANIAKMAAGVPLNDSDRAPWLAQLNIELKKHPHAVLSCSALKADYRNRLLTDLPNALMVHALGSFDTLLARTQARQASGHHFMPAALLKSQFETLELPSSAERCVTVSCDNNTAVQVSRVISHLNRPRRST